jgi:hypothetical protein
MVFLLSAASAWKIILPLTNVKRATKKISILLHCISPKGHLLKVAPSGKEESHRPKRLRSGDDGLLIPTSFCGEG